MSRTVMLPLLFAVALAGCQRQQPVAATAPATPAPQARVQAAGTLTTTGPSHLDGYGPMRFGMTAAEMRAAWTGVLQGQPAKGQICYYLAPTAAASPAPAFMVEADKFVRYDVHAAAEAAPGGGRVGMTVDQIRGLYAGRLQESAHKYISGGLVLRTRANDAGGGVLLFETDAGGKVTTWRVGQAPQVDYAEGCS